MDLQSEWVMDEGRGCLVAKQKTYEQACTSCQLPPAKPLLPQLRLQLRPLHLPLQLTDRPTRLACSGYLM